MKRCSAWNWQTLDYVYYECPGAQSVGGWEPPNVTRTPAGGGGGIGQSIEDFLPALPAGCKVVGRGPDAIGQIVKPVSSSVLGGFGIFPIDWPAKQLAVNVALGVAGVLIVRWLVGSK